MNESKSRRARREADRAHKVAPLTTSERAERRARALARKARRYARQAPLPL